METKLWKDIPGYEGRYSIREDGVIQSLCTGCLLAPRKDKRGYLMVNLEPFGEYKKQKTYTIHYLVIYSFKGPRPKGYTINHLDGVKENNHFSNLEYCTYHENMQHAHDIGLMQNNSFKVNHPYRGKFGYSHNRSIPVCQIDRFGKIVKQWGSARLAAQVLMIDSASISRACTGKQRTAGGYTWKFYNS